MSENDHYVDPTPELFAAFKALDRETPILMLNMLRFLSNRPPPCPIRSSSASTTRKLTS